MMQEIISLATGLGVGAVFGFVGAAVPAPPNVANVAGILGIVGITLGYVAMTAIRR